jgi:hypothetical protein
LKASSTSGSAKAAISSVATLPAKNEDRSGRAAVLRAVVDAGQHDQGRGRLQCIGERQQHRQRRHRAESRQHADQRADQRAGEAVGEVLQRQRGGQAQRQVAQQFHGAATPLTFP